MSDNLKLEDGKTYKSGNGDTVTVTLIDENSDFPFRGDNNIRYMSDGRYILEDDQPMSCFKLISEV